MMPAEARARLTIPEIAERLAISPTAVYKLLEAGEIPGIRRPGCRRKLWIVTRSAFSEWERTCGMERKSA